MNLSILAPSWRRCYYSWKLFSLQDKLLNSMTQEAPEPAGSGESGCVTCLESRAVMMVFPCNHTALCRLCFVKMIKHVMTAQQQQQSSHFPLFIRVSAGKLSSTDPSRPFLIYLQNYHCVFHPFQFCCPGDWTSEVADSIYLGLVHVNKKSVKS